MVKDAEQGPTYSPGQFIAHHKIEILEATMENSYSLNLYPV